VATLTKRTVDAAKPHPRRDVMVWDDELRGFGLRVYPTGRKVFLVQYRMGGRGAPQRRLKLGAYGPLTADDARKDAARALRLVAEGRDPAGEKADARELARLTLRKAVDEWLADSEGKRRASTIRLYRSLFGNLVDDDLGGRPVALLTHGDLARWHAGLRRTPYQANRALAALASMFRWAMLRGYRPAATGNPCTGVARFAEQKRDRFLSEAELGAVGDALAAAAKAGLNPYVVAALRLLALTGARRDEIRTLRWEHVDLARALLLLPQSKTGAKAVHLPAAAVQLLDGLRRIKGNPYVFPGQGDAAPLSNLNRPWTAIAAAAGLAGVRLHDLRHTFAALGAGAGMSLPLLGKLLGHRQAATTQRYAHLADDPVRRAAEAIGATADAALRSGPGQAQQDAPQATADSGDPAASADAPGGRIVAMPSRRSRAAR
jgi:integrase